MGSKRALPEGNLTEEVYNLIKKEHFEEAGTIVKRLLQRFCASDDKELYHPLLGLLGYCLYMTKDFKGAAQTYKMLHEAFPDSAEYKLHTAYCLLQCGTSHVNSAPAETSSYRQSLDGADSASFQRESSTSTPSYFPEFANGSSWPEEFKQTDFALLESAVLYRRGNFKEGRRIAAAASSELGWTPSLAYNEALCAFKLGEMNEAVELAEKILSVYRENKVNVAVGSDGFPNVMLCGGSGLGNGIYQHCAEEAAVEAANICCAADIARNHINPAKDYLCLLSLSATDRADCVSLHNKALTIASSDPKECIRMLAKLLEEPSCPPTTIRNLVILYCKHGYVDAAEELLTACSDFPVEGLSEYEAGFLKSIILGHSSPVAAERHLETLERQIGEEIRGLRGHTGHTGMYSCSSVMPIQSLTRATLQKRIDELILVIMSLANFYCGTEELSKAELLLRRYGDLCCDLTSWRINMGHILYMQKKYASCLAFYAPSIRSAACKEPLQWWQITVMANALAANIILGNLDEAQQLLNVLNAGVEPTATEAIAEFQRNNSIPNSCIAKLIIGTLYCAEKCYDYGIKAVIDSLEPLESAFNTETWAQCKTCIGALLTDLALGSFIMDENLRWHTASFLHKIEAESGRLKCNEGGHTFSHEAQALRQMLSLLA